MWLHFQLANVRRLPRVGCVPIVIVRRCILLPRLPPPTPVSPVRPSPAPLCRAHACRKLARSVVLYNSGMEISSYLGGSHSRLVSALHKRTRMKRCFRGCGEPCKLHYSRGLLGTRGWRISMHSLARVICRGSCRSAAGGAMGILSVVWLTPRSGERAMNGSMLISLHYYNSPRPPTPYTFLQPISHPHTP